MLFHSFEFIGLFLPLTLAGYILLRRQTGQRYLYVWLSAASILFYAWWDYRLSWLIVASILVNYTIGKKVNQRPPEKRRKLLVLGILANLTPLFYYKYSLFFLENFLRVTGNPMEFEQLILPLGISFFTFQQITYIMDAYKGEAPDYSFFHYATFVTFFPQLIAGPIVHHKEMMPQFDSKSKTFPHLSENLIIGLGIFSIGLFKKVIIADSLATVASPIYQQEEIGEILFFEGWFAALGYTFQLYFDFSGYSDMAIGLARMFGIVLPANFYSPYKARSIIDFWRRWHLTLSRFLKDYVYIPLGGNRRSKIRNYANLMGTMLIGGLWHGAGWTFIFWGFLHGLYLTINHFWRTYFATTQKTRGWLYAGTSWILTFLAVVIGWVFFRAESFGTAMAILEGMFLFNGIEIPKAICPALVSELSWITISEQGGMAFGKSIVFIVFAGLIAWFAPNTLSLFEKYNPVLQPTGFAKDSSSFRFQPSFWWVFFITVLLYTSLLEITQNENTEFLYFNF